MGRGINSAMAVGLAGTVGGAVARRDPVGLDDIRFVEAKRRECPRIGWQALAQMTQRNVHDLRMRCDAAYRRAHGAPACAGVSGSGRRPSPRVSAGTLSRKRAVADVISETCRARVLRAVARGAQTSAEVARALGWNVYQATALLYQLTEEGKLDRRLPCGKRRGYLYRVSECGLDAIAAGEAG